MLGEMCVRSINAAKKAKCVVLTDTLEKVLSGSGLPKALTAEAAGGTLGRHALGRAICASEHWRDPVTGDLQKRDARTKAFLGWRVKEVPAAQLHEAIMAKFITPTTATASATASASEPALTTSAEQIGPLAAAPVLPPHAMLSFGAGGTVTMPEQTFATFMVLLNQLAVRCR